MTSSKLSKSLNVVQLTYYGVGTIVGAGIYAVIGSAAGEAGYYLWISFVLAAIAASFSALSYAELASAFPNAGAEYVFLKQAFPQTRLLSYATGFLISFHGSATLATVALAFAGYFNVFFTVPIIVVAYALILLSTGFNISGIKKASWINILFTSAQLLGLLFLVIVGFMAGKKEVEPEPIAGKSILAATAIIFYIFTGYEHMATLTEETRNPGWAIPRAFIASLIVSTVVYLLIVFSVFNLTTPDMLSRSSAPLADAGSKAYSWMAQVVGIAALFATANTALSASVSVSRLLFGMSRDGDMPSKLSRTNKAKSPWIAALIVLVVAGLMIPFDEIEIVASLSSLGALLVFAAINLSLIVLRVKQPDLKRPFKVPLRVGRIPVLPVLGVLVSLGLATQYRVEVYLALGAAIAIGLGIFYLAPFRKHALKSSLDKEMQEHSH